MPAARGLTLGQADRGHLGIAEDNPRNSSEIGSRRFPEDVCARDPRLVCRHMGERHRSGDVADRPDALRGAASLIDLDPAVGAVDADVLEREAVGCRSSPRRDDQLTGLEFRSALERDDTSAVVPCDRGRLSPETHVDAFAPKRIGDQLADPRVFAREQPIA